MANGIVLAVELAKIKLAYEFNKENVVAAFEDRSKEFDRTFGDAMELFAPTLGPSGLCLLKKFDDAEMELDEMAFAIWEAAEHHYLTEIEKEDKQ